MTVSRPPANGSLNTTREADRSPSPGRLFIVSAPSGAGKSTLCALLRERLPRLRYSVSSTTRPPRPGEIDGVDYHFIEEPAFRDGIAAGRWVEWARVHGHYYGTSSAYIDRMLALGHDLLLDIDVQGADLLVKQYPRAVTIFIMPPSIDTLEQRLKQRGTDSEDVIDRRLHNARDEMAARHRYRHIVVNDHLERAVEDLAGILAPHDHQTSGDDGAGG